jgi:hypothetical protein
MPKKEDKPDWQFILDLPFGPEPRAVDKAALPHGLEPGLIDLHKDWVRLRDMKLIALALREQTLTPAGQVDYRGLALALAMKHEAGLKNRRPRGRPQELHKKEATEARKALVAYVISEAQRKPVDHQSTHILDRLSKDKAKLAAVHPYYENEGRQSLGKLKKDYQKGKEEEAERERFAEILRSLLPAYGAAGNKTQSRGLLEAFGSLEPGSVFPERLSLNVKNQDTK